MLWVVAAVSVLALGISVYTWYELARTTRRLVRIESLLWMVSPETAKRIEEGQTRVTIGDQWEEEPIEVVEEEP